MKSRAALLAAAMLIFLSHASALHAQVTSISMTPIIEAGYVQEECDTDIDDSDTEDNYEADVTCTFDTPQGGSSSCQNGPSFESATCIQQFGILPGGLYQTSGQHSLDLNFDSACTPEYADPLGYQFASGSCGSNFCVSTPLDDGTLYCYSANQLSLAITRSSTVTTISISPLQSEVGAGGTITFTTNVSSANWVLSPASGEGKLNSSSGSTVVYAAPSAVAIPTDLTITVTNSANPNDQASTTISLTPAAVSILPDPPAEMNQGQTQSFTATVTGNSNPAVTWSINPSPPGGGQIANGNYTAPPAVATQQEVTITATSVADTSQSASVTVTLLPVSITLAPVSPFVAVPGLQVPLSATLTGAVNSPTLTWTPGAPFITSTGPDSAYYTVPSTPITTQTQVQVTAADPLTPPVTSSALTLTLIPPVVITAIGGTWAAGQVSTVTLTGTGFGTAPAVTLSDSNIVFSVTSATNTSIQGTVTIPAYAQPEVVTVYVTAGGVRSPGGNVSVVPVTLTLTVQPSGTLSIIETQSQPFTASIACKSQNGGTCTPTSSTATWLITSNPAQGTLGQNTGIYTNTATGYSSVQTVTAKACANANPSVCQLFQITLTPIAVSVSPTAETLTSGKTQTFTASVSGTTGASGTTNVTWSINPVVGNISTSGPSASTVYTAPSPVAAAQMVTVKACSTVDASRCNSSAQVTLQTTPDFGIQASPTVQTVNSGSSTTYTVTVSSIDGFTGNVALSASGLPTGATGQFSPTSVAGAGLSTFTVTVPGSTATANYGLVITGTSGSLVHSVNVTLKVVHPYPIIGVNWNATLIAMGSTFTYPSTTPAGTPTSVAFAITNTGTASLNVSPPNIEQPIQAPVVFTVIAEPSTPVAPGGNTSFRLRLESSTPGTFTGYTVVISSDDPATPFYTFNVQGTVTPASEPVISITGVAPGSTFTFPSSTPVGTPVSVLFTINNTGTANLVISNPSALVAFGSAFFQIGSPPTTPVLPGGNTTFRVRLLSTTAGTYTETVSIESNDSVNPAYSFIVKGTVTP
jgi:hypothetical protein